MYSAKTDLFAQIMRIVEIFCIPLHLLNILFSVELITVILIREFTDDPIADMKPRPTYTAAEMKDLSKTALFLMDKCAKSDFQALGGQVFEWMIIEVSVYMFFIMTHLILMIKSRFIMVGMDNSEQFEPSNMTLIAKKITKLINYKMDNAQDFYIGKERMVQVDGVPLKVCMTQKFF